MVEIISLNRWSIEKGYHQSLDEFYLPEMLMALDEAANRTNGYFVIDSVGATLLDWDGLLHFLSSIPAIQVKRETNHPRLVMFAGDAQEILETVKDHLYSAREEK